MAKQKFFRAHITIEEQKNFYYTVRTDSFTTGSLNGTPMEYPNLSWEEVGDLVEHLMHEFSTDRTKNHQTVVGLSPWVQLSLDGLMPLPS